MKTNAKNKPVAVVVGATSKWQSDGRNTLLAHGKPVDDSNVEVGVRWGVGGAIAQKFAQEGFFTVLTTRKAANASALAQAIGEQGGDCMIVELDLVSQDSIAKAFDTIRREAGDPDVLVYNAGYLEGRDLPPDKELLEHIPVEMFDTTQHIDSPGTRALPRNQNRRDHVINPVKIAEAFYYLHTQDPSCWTHELQLTPFPSKPSY